MAGWFLIKDGSNIEGPYPADYVSAELYGQPTDAVWLRREDGVGWTKAEEIWDELRQEALGESNVYQSPQSDPAYPIPAPSEPTLTSPIKNSWFLYKRYFWRILILSTVCRIPAAYIANMAVHWLQSAKDSTAELIMDDPTAIAGIMLKTMAIAVSGHISNGITSLYIVAVVYEYCSQIQKHNPPAILTTLTRGFVLFCRSIPSTLIGLCGGIFILFIIALLFQAKFNWDRGLVGLILTLGRNAPFAILPIGVLFIYCYFSPFLSYQKGNIGLPALTKSFFLLKGKGMLKFLAYIIPCWFLVTLVHSSLNLALDKILPENLTIRILFTAISSCIILYMTFFSYCLFRHLEETHV